MALRATKGDENKVRRLQSHERSDWTLPNRARFAAFFDGVAMGLRPTKS
jgi:hypothetical protein